MINKINTNYKCVFSSENSLYNNKYIQSSKFISDNSFLIINDKSIIKYNYDYKDLNNSFESIKLQNEFSENNYIYDYDIIPINNLDNQYICLCSKDNPIRIINDKLSLVKSFSLERKIHEKYYSSTFIKFEEFGMNIFTGKNFLSKIDLIKEKEVFIKFNKNYNYLSSFDYNQYYSCYFLGSYDRNLLFCDYKTDNITQIYQQEKPINEIKLLKTKMNQMIIGYKNSDYLSLFDIRKMDQCINKFERNALTTKKINFVLDEQENHIYSGDVNGNIIKYSLNKEIVDKSCENYQNNFINEKINVGINNCITSIDLEERKKLLIVTFEENKQLENDEENIEIIKEEKKCNFKIFKIEN